MFLHYEILKNYLDETSDFEASLTMTQELEDDINRRMEIQANMFAATLLIPEIEFYTEVNNYFEVERIHRPYLWLDHQPVNQALVMGMLSRIQGRFGVSKECAKYRLIGQGLIRSDIEGELIGNIFKTMGLEI